MKRRFVPILALVLAFTACSEGPMEPPEAAETPEQIVREYSGAKSACIFGTQNPDYIFINDCSTYESRNALVEHIESYEGWTCDVGGSTGDWSAVCQKGESNVALAVAGELSDSGYGIANAKSACYILDFSNDLWCTSLDHAYAIAQVGYESGAECDVDHRPIDPYAEYSMHYWVVSCEYKTPR